VTDSFLTWWFATAKREHRRVRDEVGRQVIREVNARPAGIFINSWWDEGPTQMDRWEAFVAGWTVRAVPPREVEGFTMDAFADPTGEQRVAPKFRSARSPFDPTRFRGETVWAFPPVSLVQSFLAEVEEWEADRVVALLPAVMCPAVGWRVLARYSARSRVFIRWIGWHRERCAASGFEWVVTEWVADRYPTASA